jgi:hypothetical protein
MVGKKHYDGQCSLRESKESRNVSGQPRDTMSVENECMWTWHFQMQNIICVYLFRSGGTVAQVFIIFHIINRAYFGCPSNSPPSIPTHSGLHVLATKTHFLLLSSPPSLTHSGPLCFGCQICSLSSSSVSLELT